MWNAKQRAVVPTWGAGKAHSGVPPAAFGNIWRHLVVTVGRGENTAMYWVEAKDTTKHATTQRTFSTIENPQLQTPVGSRWKRPETELYSHQHEWVDPPSDGGRAHQFRF